MLAAVMEPEAVDESQEKVAEADYLGRVMAHAMVQELNEIEKAAGRGVGSGGVISEEEAKAFLESKPKTTGQAFAEAHKKPGLMAKLRGGAGKAYAHQAGAFKQVGEGARALFGAGGKGARGAAALKMLAGLGKASPTIAAGGAGLYGLHRGAKAVYGKDKESSALDTLAIERAQQMLAEAGYGQDKLASASNVGEAVEIRALQMLEEAGYPVQWNR